MPSPSPSPSLSAPWPVKFRVSLSALIAVAILGVATIPPAVVGAQENPDPIAPAEAVWNPTATWVFAVGVLEFEEQGLSGWPNEGRKDAELIALWKSRGVPSEQIVFLQNRDARINAIRRQFDQFVRKPGEESTLFVYFTGHGVADATGTYFTAYDFRTRQPSRNGWSVRSIFDVIDAHFRGRKAVLMADCCYAGALGVEVERRRESRIAFASFGSSAPNAVSTNNWTFTETLIDGFSGGPGRLDTDGNGHIDVREMASHAETTMMFVEMQMPTIQLSERFPSAWRVAESAAEPAVGQWYPRQFIDVRHGETEWRRAQIIDRRTTEAGELELRVRYPRQAAADAEWTNAERIRTWRPEKQFAPQTPVEVEWQGSWYAATVLNEKAGFHYISYDGYDASWNEWVGPERIRPRTAQENGE